MAKHDDQFKLTVVQDYLSGSEGFEKVAMRYGMDKSLLRKWVDCFRLHGEVGLTRKKKRQDFSGSFKLSVLERIHQEGLSYRQAAAMFNVHAGNGTIAGGVRQYHEGGFEALEPKPRGGKKKMPVPTVSTPPKTPQSLAPSVLSVDERQELQKLRQANEYLVAEAAYLKKLKALVR